MNQKLGLHECFLNEDDPYILFDAWMKEAEKTEPNDPNAFSVATSDSSGQPDVRMVLLKGISKTGFIFYTNLEGKKGRDLKYKDLSADNPYSLNNENKFLNL